ncbi:hypothetical protein A6U97_26505 [Agrobacterium tumefaciens]|uniref:hypothetical protein n=1 Tax=Agrobacterium tumefaciens TaxID=358 RepID=UPI000810075A|nr:hypothetical protein A6U97_26505 [Agrobacterium tumefaciens]
MPDVSEMVASTACTAINCLSAAVPPVASSVPWWWTAFAVPFLSAGLAVMGAWVAIGFDRRKSVNQELIKKRIAVYDDVIPKTNDMLCYFNCIGDWRTLDPDKLLDHKRKLDRAMNVYGALFSAELDVRYHAFIDACFSTYEGRGKPAKLRANTDFLKRQWGDDWVLKWDACFMPVKDALGRDDLRPIYDAMLGQFAIEIGARRLRKKK